MIYLAIPYSGMEELSFKISCMVTAFLMKAGKTVYSPVVNGHILATKCDLPADREFWLKHDLDMLRRCDELYVVTLDGWAESVGVLGEIDEALSMGMHVTFIDPTPFVEKRNKPSVDLRPKSSRDILERCRRNRQNRGDLLER